MERQEVYQLIDGERTYQKSVEADPTRCGQTIHETPHATGEYLVMLKIYLDRAFAAWVNTPNPSNEVLANILKIAGIAVHCMEDHGAPAREL